MPAANDAVSDDPDRPAAPRPWDDWVGRPVVIDTDSQYLYLGLLEGFDGTWVSLTDADVHDVAESQVTREKYLSEALEYGIKPNRRRVWLLAGRIVSVALIDDTCRF